MRHDEVSDKSSVCFNFTSGTGHQELHVKPNLRDLALRILFVNHEFLDQRVDTFEFYFSLTG